MTETNGSSFQITSVDLPHCVHCSLETIVLPIFSSPGSIQLGWTSFSVYFAAALLVTLLLCGIQLVNDRLIE